MEGASTAVRDKIFSLISTPPTDAFPIIQYSELGNYAFRYVWLNDTPRPILRRFSDSVIR
jgi:hypothetical protein